MSPGPRDSGWVCKGREVQKQQRELVGTRHHYKWVPHVGRPPSDFADQFEGQALSPTALGSPGSGGTKAAHNTRVLRGPAHVHCGGPTSGGCAFPSQLSLQRPGWRGRFPGTESHERGLSL